MLTNPWVASLAAIALFLPLFTLNAIMANTIEPVATLLRLRSPLDVTGSTAGIAALAFCLMLLPIGAYVAWRPIGWPVRRF